MDSRSNHLQYDLAKRRVQATFLRSSHMTTAIAPINLVVPDDPPSSQSPSGRSLLVLDHDRFVREACREAAIFLGYRASATDSVEQALWLVDSQRVDVVLLDLNLPGGVGLDVLQQL